MTNRLPPPAGSAILGYMERGDDEQQDYSESGVEPSVADGTLTELAGLGVILFVFGTIALAALLSTGVLRLFR